MRVLESTLLLATMVLLITGCSRRSSKRSAQATATVVLTPSTSELPIDWSPADFRAALKRAADLWSYPNVPCNIHVAVGDPRAEWRAVHDGTDLVVVRGRSWCHNGRCSAATTYPLRAMAMTTTYPEGAFGHAVTEGDIEINGVFFQFADPAGRPGGLPPRRTVRLESVLAHEIGHVLGLPDVCGENRTTSGRPLTAACGPDDRERMMFASGAHEALAPADVAALCALYPPAG